MSAWLSTSIRVAVIVAYGTLSVAEVRAQCEQKWFAGPPDSGLILDSTSIAMVEFQEHLYVGMVPSSTNTVMFQRWDGFAWEPLQWTSGISLEGIQVMLPYRDELIVGGWLWKDGSFGLVRWDGAQAHTMGSGLSGHLLPNPHALLEWDGSLIVAGQFDYAGGVPATDIARWDGAEWHALGEGLGASPFSYVNALAEHLNSPIAGVTHAIGGTGNLAVARWTGTQWDSLELPLSANEQSWWIGIASFNQQLFCAGTFGPIGKPELWEHRSFRFDGVTWHLVKDSGAKGFSDMRAAGGELFLNAAFKVSSGWTTLARWIGDAWEPLDSPAVIAAGMAAYGNGLIIAGGLGLPSPLAPFARWGCVCPPDCDENGGLDIRDFICFQTYFAVGDDRGDCDGDGAYTIEDFVCFQSAYAAGC